MSNNDLFFLATMPLSSQDGVQGLPQAGVQGCAKTRMQAGAKRGPQGGHWEEVHCYPETAMSTIRPHAVSRGPGAQWGVPWCTRGGVWGQSELCDQVCGWAGVQWCDWEEVSPGDQAELLRCDGASVKTGASGGVSHHLHWAVSSGAPYCHHLCHRTGMQDTLCQTLLLILLLKVTFMYINLN